MNAGEPLTRSGQRRRIGQSPPARRFVSWTAARAVLVALALVGAALASAASASDASLQAGSGAFSDDDGSFAESALNALAAKGYLAGTECGEELICPDRPLKRWEMAVWLGRTLSSGEPPQTGDSRFADVGADEWWAPHVERFADLGVTTGCGTEPLSFCPGNPVTRAQMATFFKRAFELRDARSAGFADTTGNFHAADIDALAAAGVTAGCNSEPLRYCPAQDVNRAQMAIFLARALRLVPLPSYVQYKSVSVSPSHACGLRFDDAIQCWGGNSSRESEAPSGRFKAVAAGSYFSCAVRDDGTIACWGLNPVTGAPWDDHSGLPSGEFRAVEAGDFHACGIRTDDTAVCWGDDSDGQSNPPDGSYRDISAGAAHSCGLRTDKAIVCWGSNAAGQTDVPDGEYEAATAGERRSCALTTDGTVVCWGGYNEWAQSDAPPERFKAVSAGTAHTCGVQTDGTVSCWGDNFFGQAEAPSGSFKSVSVGQSRSCGLRTDNMVVCWGTGQFDDGRIPGGKFISVAAGEEHSCALRADRTVACWGLNSNGQAYPPDGEFQVVTTGTWHTCGLETDGYVTCWGDDSWGQGFPPEGEYKVVEAGTFHSCGIRADNTAVCWGDDSDGQSSPPDGHYMDIVAGTSHSCGLRTDNAVVCWGSDVDGQAQAPSGDYKAVTASLYHSCGLRTDGTIVCWGSDWDGQLDAPDGKFAALSGGDLHSCALSVENTVTCWGADFYGQTAAPSGMFKDVSAGSAHSCAVGAGDDLVCWGQKSLMLTPPAAVEYPIDWDPSGCRIFGPLGTWGEVTVGFPLPRAVAPADGTLRLAMLFTDFHDAQAKYPTDRQAELGGRFMKQYLQAASYGKFDVFTRALHKWLRVEHGYKHYFGEELKAIVEKIDNEVIQQADPEFDFLGFGAVMIVMPSTYFGGGNVVLGEYLEGRVNTDEGTIAAVSRVNTFPIDPESAIIAWGLVGAHELAHNLGLADLYPYDDTAHQLPDPPAGRVWITAEFGLMGLRAYFLANEGDRRLAGSFQDPGGSRLSYDSGTARANEMLAWSRWQLGWLDASQIQCVTERSATVELAPVADPGIGIAMAAIPIGETQAIVIESRRRIGYDTEAVNRYLDGSVETFPALLDEGILVYTVDSEIHSGELPIKVAGDTGNGQVDRYPLLTEGQSVTVSGYTITVVSDDGETHTARITKSG